MESVLQMRRGDGQHQRVAQLLQGLLELQVGRAVAGFGLPDMVGLVNNHKAHAARARQARGVDGEELRCGEDDVEAAFGEVAVGLGALLLFCLAREDTHLQAKVPVGLGQVEGLVCHEGAQGIDEDARLALQQGRAGGVEVEDQALAAARGHDG